ncbi:MAG: YidC/Oxa1 family membrane protein insertase [Firmicutes bacterium]|nr:YidC/Oxa1 family membrane protein insertase [Bacillota bacterium]
MFEMLQSIVVFPEQGGAIARLVYNVLGWLYGGVGSYGLAVILFALLLRTVLIPIDFGTKYFTKQNSLRMAEIKPEDDAIRIKYADDPVTMNQKRQELYRKHGAGAMGGFCLFTILNIVMIFVVFISMFQALGVISNYNVNNQFLRLQAIHQEWDGYHDTEEFAEAIRAEYSETRVGFLWVTNVWRPDTPWTARVLDFDQFRSAISGVSDRATYGLDAAGMDALRAQYNEIFSHIDDTDRRLNGWLLLILLAGGATYAGAVISAKVMARTKPITAKKENEEPEIGYGIRNVKNQAVNDGTKKPDVPSFDPAQMGKMMKIIMPLVMIGVTMTMTSALAIYIIASSIISTVYAIGLNVIIDKMLKRKEAKKKESAPDMTIINPHAKYFKSK